MPAHIQLVEPGVIVNTISGPLTVYDLRIAREQSNMMVTAMTGSDKRVVIVDLSSVSFSDIKVSAKEIAGIMKFDELKGAVVGYITVGGETIRIAINAYRTLIIGNFHHAPTVDEALVQARALLAASDSTATASNPSS